MIFPVVMYGCEIWTVKKAECRRIDAFELWCWRRLLRVLWTARRSIQDGHPKEDKSWVFIERTNAEAETSIFWPLMTLWKRLWCWEGLGAGREGDDRGWEYWMASLTQWTWIWVNSRSWRWTGRPSVLQFTGSQRVGQDWATELNKGLSHRTCVFMTLIYFPFPSKTIIYQILSIPKRYSKYLSINAQTTPSSSLHCYF